MRGIVSLVAAGLVAGGLWGGLSLRASEAKADRLVEPLPDSLIIEPHPRQTQSSELPSEAQLRSELNQRLKIMINEGKGARLMDATSHPVRKARATEGVRSVRYRAPRLDLTTPPHIPDNALDCLTQAIYYEARNESEIGQAAVAEVVINRVRHPSYPKTVCEVVYQRNSRTCQFTFTCDGSVGRGRVGAMAWMRAQKIAREVLDGSHVRQLPHNSVNYHAEYVRPTWGQRLDKVRQIGAHIFYQG